MKIFLKLMGVPKLRTPVRKGKNYSPDDQLKLKIRSIHASSFWLPNSSREQLRAKFWLKSESKKPKVKMKVCSVSPSPAPRCASSSLTYWNGRDAALRRPLTERPVCPAHLPRRSLAKAVAGRRERSERARLKWAWLEGHIPAE
jgi:hypothetical protein